VLAGRRPVRYRRDLGDVEPRNALRNASRFANTIDQLSPTSNTPSVSASNIADLS
jgi:hypothetical protein